MVSNIRIDIVGIGPNADAMLLIAKGEVIGNDGISRGMPQINAIACIIIGNIIDNMPSGIGMIDRSTYWHNLG